jgi:hypothetical protein
MEKNVHQVLIMVELPTWRRMHAPHKADQAGLQ